MRSLLRKTIYCVVVATSLAMLSASNAKETNQVAPDFSRVDLAGNQMHLAGYRGKLVLLNFWASWCGPCREEMPRFSQWQKEYGAKGLQIVGVSMDDDPKDARDFLKQHAVSYPIVMGDAKLGETFGGILGLPTTYLIDSQGRIIARYRGESNLKKMEAQIQKLLSDAAH